MEFWLKQGSKTLRLPIPPKEYVISTSNTNDTVKVEGVGEISFIGTSNLSTATIESIFPNHLYSFCQYSTYPKPANCVALINKWRNSGKPIRYIITGTKINMKCTIESFEYKEQDGTGNIFFTLELKEYKIIDLESFIDKSITYQSKRETPSQQSKTYTVRKGDYPYLIAQKMYGDGNRYKEILSKNNIKNFNTVKVGTVLEI